MRVLVADRIDEVGVAGLQDMGCDVTVKPDLVGEALVRAVDQTACHVLVVRGTQVTADAIRVNKQLSLIIRVGAGYDSIDIQAASADSVFVANCPGKNAAAVAELTFGLMLALDRRIPDNVVDLRCGRWAKKAYSASRGLKGRTLGIIGVGQIGELVARRAQAFEMNVVGWSRSLTSAKASRLGMVRVDLPEEVAVGSDIVTVHLAASMETNRLVGKNIFDEMKAHSCFINTSRAEVVDYDALAQAVVEKDIRVGLDVFQREPPPHEETFDDPIVKLDGIVYGTHHIGASTEQAQTAAAEEMVAIVKEYLNTGHVLNCVNLSIGKIPHGVLVVRQRNKPGVLAKVLSVLAQKGINVREMENVMCAGELSACAQIRLDSKPDEHILKEIREADSENILGVSMTHSGY